MLNIKKVRRVVKAQEGLDTSLLLLVLNGVGKQSLNSLLFSNSSDYLNSSLYSLYSDNTDYGQLAVDNISQSTTTSTSPTILRTNEDRLDYARNQLPLYDSFLGILGSKGLRNIKSGYEIAMDLGNKGPISDKFKITTDDMTKNNLSILLDMSKFKAPDKIDLDTKWVGPSKGKVFMNRAVGMGKNLINAAPAIAGGVNMMMSSAKALNDIEVTKTHSLGIDKNAVASVGGGFSGSMNRLMKIKEKAGKSQGILDIITGKTKRTNDEIDRGLLLSDELSNLAFENNRIISLKDTMLDINTTNYTNKIRGNDPSTLRVNAKNGAKLEWNPIIISDAEFFKDGGKIKEEEPLTNLKSLIPEGALHKNKHHMDNDSNITKKGIPVVDNDGELLAEIELNEIIFTLEVTQKLEELAKKGTDEAAIEAGKLLVKEILYNTDDRTGLIKTLKKGGSLNLIEDKSNKEINNQQNVSTIVGEKEEKPQ